MIDIEIYVHKNQQHSQHWGFVLSRSAEHSWKFAGVVLGGAGAADALTLCLSPNPVATEAPLSFSFLSRTWMSAHIKNSISSYCFYFSSFLSPSEPCGIWYRPELPPRAEGLQDKLMEDLIPIF